jgi:hypothetical protein
MRCKLSLEITNAWSRAERERERERESEQWTGSKRMQLVYVQSQGPQRSQTLGGADWTPGQTLQQPRPCSAVRFRVAGANKRATRAKSLSQTSEAAEVRMSAAFYRTEVPSSMNTTTSPSVMKNMLLPVVPCAAVNNQRGQVVNAFMHGGVVWTAAHTAFPL